MNTPAEMNADIKRMEEQPPQIIMPAHFAAPHQMPVHVDVMGAYDERGVWWIVQRVETVHGSHIAFLTPETAKVVEAELAASRAAQITTPFVPGQGAQG